MSLHVFLIAVCWAAVSSSALTLLLLPGFHVIRERLLGQHASPAVLWPKSVPLHTLQLAQMIVSLAILPYTGPPIGHRTSRNPENLWSTFILMLYVSVLSVTSILTRSRSSRRATHHVCYLLSLLFALECLKVALPSTNRATSASTWAVLVLALLGGIISPLLTPRNDLILEPVANPIPSQRASWIGFLTFLYLDPMITQGYKSEHLSVDALPNIQQNHTSDHLFASSKKLIFKDKSARPYLFIGLLQLLWKEHLEIGLLTLVAIVSKFAAPIGLNRLLAHLEGSATSQRPWVWILWIGLSPIVQTIAEAQELYLRTSISLQSESILSQLVYERALRLRLGFGSEVDAAADPGTKDSGKAWSGRVVNLVTTDMKSLQFDRYLTTPRYVIEIVVALVILYQLLGWSSLVGTAIMILAIPVPTWIARLTLRTQERKMKLGDQRVQLVTQTMSVIRMIKLFAWERLQSDKIASIRERELKQIRLTRMLALVDDSVNTFIPMIVMIAITGAYTLIMHQSLSASIIFTSVAVLSIVRGALYMVTSETAVVISSVVSLRRFHEFFAETNVLPQRPDTSEQLSSPVIEDSTSLTTDHPSSYSWTNIWLDTSISRERVFKLSIPVKLNFKDGGVNLIVGPTASGKTTFLMSLLGELYADHESVPARQDVVAFAPQESWILNDTVRNNILFGQVFDRERYDAVLTQCALRDDLSLWSAGDSTEVGEKGITLSGGQKARITLARAIYSSAPLLLLDDVLSALDVHTAKWIVEKCLCGHLVRDRTVILVTHHLALCQPAAHYIVQLRDGRVVNHGSVSELLAYDQDLEKRIAAGATNTADEQQTHSLIDSKDLKGEEEDGRLIEEESRARGRITWPAMSLFYRSAGGGLFWILIISAVVLHRVVSLIETWVLGLWAQQYSLSDPQHVSDRWYIGIYALLVVAGTGWFCTLYASWLYGMSRVSRRIHSNLIHNVLKSTFRWLDTVPHSRVIARCTQDIATVDGQLPLIIFALLSLIAGLLTTFVTVVIFTGWIVLLSGLVILLLGTVMGAVYMKAKLSLKREASVADSPVVGHLSVTLDGLASIRAYGRENAFLQAFQSRLDNRYCIRRISEDLDRWWGIRADSLGAIFCGVVATYLVYGGANSSSATVGFTLTIAVSFAERLLWMIRVWNMFEVECNSLERIQDFLQHDREAEWVPGAVPPAYWPSDGTLIAKNLCAKYSEEGPLVLSDINFTIASGERIGIVGRTGAGKSSMALALLRCIPITGTITYGGIDTSMINLEDLRSNVTLIPQSPELLSGTLRENLDPTNEHDDLALLDALKSAGLEALQDSGQESALNLDSMITESGTNLSLGQRQIIALARALLRRSKLLILDEATASIGTRHNEQVTRLIITADHATDTAIQHSIRTRIPKGTTVITIAHRLQTVIDDDRIMVLDHGRVVEFDAPRRLIAKDGLFRSLVDSSNDQAELLALLKDAQ